VNPRPAILRSRAFRAFTLVEMMVTVALLGFIVVGLTTMFVQAQRAFRAGMNQTDVLESGRAVADLVTRQLEEAVPVRQAAVTNFAVNFRAWTTNVLPASLAARTNVLDSVYFFTHSNLTTTLNGYVVAQPGATLAAAGFGTLYYYQASVPSANSNLMAVASFNFLNVASNAVTVGIIDSNLVRVADGIVHFRLLAYTTNGTPIAATNTGYFNPQKSIYLAVTNLSPSDRELFNGVFTGNALPASADLELGVVESSTLARLNALPAGTVQQQYLARSQTAGRIHIFRRHVVLSGVDPQAYQ
jgi:prepilin-type N-terminal cleavage/methylation domain-containing protein